MAFLFCFYQLQDTSDVQVCSGHRGSIKSLCFSTDSFQLACYRRLECIVCSRCCFWQFSACIGSSCILWIGSSSSCMRFFVYTSGTLNWCKDFDRFTFYPSRCNNLPSFYRSWHEKPATCLCQANAGHGIGGPGNAHVIQLTFS